MSEESITHRPQVRMRPLPGGRCKIEVNAVVDWGTAIEIMKVLGHLGEIAEDPLDATTGAR